jgi:GNAT superfamily N-acetyltransferase
MRGFAIMEFLEEEAHLNLLAVDPSYRRAGLGRRLVRWLEESCTVAGSFVVYLEVRASNPGARATTMQHFPARKGIPGVEMISANDFLRSEHHVFLDV